MKLKVLIAFIAFFLFLFIISYFLKEDKIVNGIDKNNSDIESVENINLSEEYIQNQLKERLISKLENELDKKYAYYEVLVDLEDPLWAVGVVRGKASENTPPFIHIFLAKKLKGEVVDIAFQYTPKFDEWLRNEDISFFSDDVKKYLYSPSN